MCKWVFAEFSTFSNGGHLGWRPGSSDTILKDDHRKTIQNDLLWNLWVKWAQTMVKWSLGYPLSEFCPMAPATSQVVRNTKNSKFGKKSFKNYLLEEITFKWFSAEFSSFSNGGHLGWWPGSSNTKRTIWRSFHHSLGPFDQVVKLSALLKIKKLTKNHIKMISSETSGSNGPKLWWNGL
jgi:hypothetical protein